MAKDQKRNLSLTMTKALGGEEDIFELGVGGRGEGERGVEVEGYSNIIVLGFEKLK